MRYEFIILEDSPYCHIRDLPAHIGRWGGGKYQRSKPGRGLSSDVKAWLDDHKRRRGCVVCGESESCCLHYHHRDPSIKRFNLSEAHRQEMAVAREEAAKCDVLCANCHAKIHAGVLVLKVPDEQSSLKGSSSGL